MQMVAILRFMPYSSSEILPKVLPSFCNQDVGKLGGGERGDKIKKRGGKKPVQKISTA